MGTSARLPVVGSASLYYSRFNMKVFLFLCVLPLAWAAPAAEAEADPEADPLLYGHHLAPVHPLVYHVPNCTTVNKVRTHKVCVPKIEKKCEDVVFKSQKITFKTECKDITTKHCSDGTVDVSEAEAVSVEKRDADAEPEADPQLLAYGGLLPYHHAVAPVVEIKHHCVEHTQTVCTQVPVTEEVEHTVPHCVLVHGADCTDEEYTIPEKPACKRLLES